MLPIRPFERLFRPISTVAWLLVVAVVTLTPGAPSDASPGIACLLCGSRGLADAILNVALFLPLGFLLGVSPRRALVVGFLGATIATAVEAVQIVVPGRHPTPADILWNGLGATLGVILRPLLASMIRRTAPAWGTTLITIGIGGCVILGGWLLQPQPTAGAYWAQWMPLRPPMAPFEGTLIEVRLDGEPLPRQRIPEGRDLGQVLRGDWRMELEMTLGPRPRSLAPVLILGDEQQREILMLAVFGRDLVIRERTRASAWRLDEPTRRFRGAFRDLDGDDTISVSVRREGALRCVFANGSRSCDEPWSVGRTWSLLLGPGEIGPGTISRIDALWLFVLFAIVGFASRSVLLGILNVGILWLMLQLASVTTQLQSPTGLHAVVTVVGAVGGHIMALVTRARVGRHDDDPVTSWRASP